LPVGESGPDVSLTAIVPLIAGLICFQIAPPPYRCVDRLHRNGIDIAVGQPGLRPGQTVCAHVNAMVRTRGDKGQRKCECVDRATIDASRRSPRGPAVAAQQRARPARTGEHNALC